MIYFKYTIASLSIHSMVWLFKVFVIWQRVQEVLKHTSFERITSIIRISLLNVHHTGLNT
jgi:hypothetical protein